MIERAENMLSSNPLTKQTTTDELQALDPKVHEMQDISQKSKTTFEYIPACFGKEAA
jgi:hypothetical protein